MTWGNDGFLVLPTGKPVLQPLGKKSPRQRAQLSPTRQPPQHALAQPVISVPLSCTYPQIAFDVYGIYQQNQRAPSQNRYWTVNEHLRIYLPKPLISGLKKSQRIQTAWIYTFLPSSRSTANNNKRWRERKSIFDVSDFWRKSIVFSNRCERSTNLCHLLA